MAEQIIVNIVRPEVGIDYRAESPEAELTDRLAASELAVHALAKHVCEMRSTLGLECPALIKNLAESNTWQSGM